MFDSCISFGLTAGHCALDIKGLLDQNQEVSGYRGLFNRCKRVLEEGQDYSEKKGIAETFSHPTYQPNGAWLERAGLAALKKFFNSYIKH